MKNLVSMKDLSVEQIMAILTQAQAFRDGESSQFNKKIYNDQIYFLNQVHEQK